MVHVFPHIIDVEGKLGSTRLARLNESCFPFLLQVETDALVKRPKPGDPSFELFEKVGHGTIHLLTLYTLPGVYSTDNVVSTTDLQ